MQGRELNISQRALRPRICAYLLSRNAEPAMLETFKRGFCCGYVVLALLCYYLEKKYKIPRQDNWGWLMQVLDWLAAEPTVWKDLPKSAHLHLERFISLLEILQHTSTYLPHVAQGNLAAFFESSAGLKAELEFRIAGLFTVQHFLMPVQYEHKGVKRQTTLMSEILKYQHRLILISKGGHTFGLIRDGNEINFLESNAKALRKTASLSIGNKALVHRLFHLAKYDARTPSSFGIRIFSLEGQGEYVPAALFLIALNPPCFNHRMGYGKGYAALHIAARIGDVVSLGYYLSKTVYVNCVTQKQYTPLYLAAAKGYDLAVNLLLLHGADPHFSSKSCIGSAMQRGHHEIAASLRANKWTNLFAVKKSASLPILSAQELPALPKI